MPNANLEEREPMQPLTAANKFGEETVASQHDSNDASTAMLGQVDPEHGASSFFGGSSVGKQYLVGTSACIIWDPECNPRVHMLH